MKKKTKVNRKRKKRILTAFIVIMSISCITVLGKVSYDIIQKYRANQKSYDSLNKEVSSSVSGAKVDPNSKSSSVGDGKGDAASDSKDTNGDLVTSYTPSSPEQYRQKFAKCKSINSDYCGWIVIPNTYVNYPITKGNCAFYLKHDFYKRPSDYGCITVDDGVKVPFEDNTTILHGHHMANGTMFASLKLFKTQSFASSNRYIYIELDGYFKAYKIFSVFVEPATEQTYETGLSGNAFVEHVKWLKSKSMFNLGEFEPNENTNILILSTCSYESNNYRLLVCGYLE